MPLGKLSVSKIFSPNKGGSREGQSVASHVDAFATSQRAAPGEPTVQLRVAPPESVKPASQEKRASPDGKRTLWATVPFSGAWKTEHVAETQTSGAPVHAAPPAVATSHVWFASPLVAM
jgi:hypothetical protein